MSLVTGLSILLVFVSISDCQSISNKVEKLGYKTPDIIGDSKLFCDETRRPEKCLDDKMMTVYDCFVVSKR